MHGCEEQLKPNGSHLTAQWVTVGVVRMVVVRQCGDFGSLVFGQIGSKDKPDASSPVHGHDTLMLRAHKLECYFPSHLSS